MTPQTPLVKVSPLYNLARSTVSSCTDPNAVTCSASGFSFECLNGFVNEGGVCINQCTALLVPVTGYCFPQITISNVEYTLSLNPDNTFSIVFDAPITQAQCRDLFILR